MDIISGWHKCPWKPYWQHLMSQEDADLPLSLVQLEKRIIPEKQEINSVTYQLQQPMLSDWIESTPSSVKVARQSDFELESVRKATAKLIPLVELFRQRLPSFALLRTTSFGYSSSVYVQVSFGPSKLPGTKLLEIMFAHRHPFLTSMDASVAKPIAVEISNQLTATTTINKALANADTAINENQDELSKARTAYIKTREENQRINTILDDIKQQSMELENTFKQIDQLEMFVNHVKDTFNQVADCVGSMEKSVLANSGLSVGSIPMSFKFLSGRPTVVEAHTYFPPPREVDIVPTSTFFPSTKD